MGEGRRAALSTPSASVHPPWEWPWNRAVHSLLGHRWFHLALRLWTRVDSEEGRRLDGMAGQWPRPRTLAMSGGHWDRMQLNVFDELLTQGRVIPESMKLLGQIEHELDWGHSCDSCLACARLRVVAALDTFFDNRGNATVALSVLRDQQVAENHCDDCLRSIPGSYRREGYRPTEEECAAELEKRQEHARLKS